MLAQGAVTPRHSRATAVSRFFPQMTSTLRSGYCGGRADDRRFLLTPEFWILNPVFQFVADSPQTPGAQNGIPEKYWPPSASGCNIASWPAAKNLSNRTGTWGIERWKQFNLLTWNYRHLANAVILRQVEGIFEATPPETAARLHAGRTHGTIKQ